MQEYVLGIGVDLAEDGNYQITIETADLSGTPEDTGGNRLLQSRGANLFDAIRNAIPHAGKKLYWGHCGLIVLHEDVQGAALHEVLDVFNRAQDVYLNTSLAIARGVTAQEIFEADYAGSNSVTTHFLNIFQNQDSSRRFQQTELWQYTRNLALCDCVMLPTVSLVNQTPSISGGAVYRGTDLLTFLSGEEVLLYSLLSEEISGGWLSEIPLSPGSAISLEILSNHTEKKRDLLHTLVTVSLSSTNTSLAVQSEKARKEIESVISNTLQQRFSAFLSHAQADKFLPLLGLPPAQIPPIQVTVRLHNSGMYYHQPEETS